MTNKLTLSAPKYIWLQISDDADDLGQPMPAADETITWCADSVLAAEVGYVRADLNAALQATIARQQRAIERKDWALRMLKDTFPSDFDNMWKDALAYTGEAP